MPDSTKHKASRKKALKKHAEYYLKIKETGTEAEKKLEAENIKLAEERLKKGELDG